MHNSGNKTIITITSDLGDKDYYVASLKASILGLNKEASIVDISHSISPQDILAGAWVLKNVAFDFPGNSIHLVSIDPTSGTSRKPIVAKIKDQIFVGPDNGLFSLVAGNHFVEAYELTNTSYWASQRSSTFNARDIFAPVCGHISNGVSIGQLGVPIDEISNYKWAVPTNDSESINGWIVHIDHFGNLITNIPKKLYDNNLAGRSSKLYVGNVIIHGMKGAFNSVPEGEAVAYMGSSGMIEIAINKGNAMEMLGVQKGAPVTILFK